MHIKVDRCSVNELQFEDSVIVAVCNIQPPTGINRHTVRTVQTNIRNFMDALPFHCEEGDFYLLGSLGCYCNMTIFGHCYTRWAFEHIFAKLPYKFTALLKHLHTVIFPVSDTHKSIGCNANLLGILELARPASFTSKTVLVMTTLVKN